jgi:hypothetical protein
MHAEPTPGRRIYSAPPICRAAKHPLRSPDVAAELRWQTNGRIRMKSAVADSLAPIGLPKFGVMAGGSVSSRTKEHLGEPAALNLAAACDRSFRPPRFVCLAYFVVCKNETQAARPPPKPRRLPKLSTRPKPMTYTSSFSGGRFVNSIICVSSDVFSSK